MFSEHNTIVRYPLLAGLTSAAGIFLTAVAIKLITDLIESGAAVLMEPLTWVLLVLWVCSMISTTSFLNAAMERADAQHVVPVYFAVQVEKKAR